MHEPLLLVDNDVLLKAAHWDLLDWVPWAASTKWEHVAVVPQLPPRARRADPKLFRDPIAAQRLNQVLGLTTALPLPDVGVIATMQGAPGVDPGELLLVAGLASAPRSALLTGDKRALRTFASPALRAALSNCQQRILCIDTWLLGVFEELGPDEFCRRIRHCAECDKALLAIVGREGERSEENLREGLQSYANAIERETASLLGPVPFSPRA